MTHRTSFRPRVGVSEDAFGTPPAARSGMMAVAGASDDDLENGEELITDGDPDEYEGNDPVGAPCYDEGFVRVGLGDLRAVIAEVIKKSGGKWVLMTKHKKNGKRRKLGTHASLASAKRQEKAIHAHGG